MSTDCPPRAPDCPSFLPDRPPRAPDRPSLLPERASFLTDRPPRLPEGVSFLTDQPSPAPDGPPGETDCPVFGQCLTPRDFRVSFFETESAGCRPRPLLVGTGPVIKPRDARTHGRVFWPLLTPRHGQCPRKDIRTPRIGHGPGGTGPYRMWGRARCAWCPSQFEQGNFCRNFFAGRAVFSRCLMPRAGSWNRAEWEATIPFCAVFPGISAKILHGRNVSEAWHTRC